VRRPKKVKKDQKRPFSNLNLWVKGSDLRCVCLFCLLYFLKITVKKLLGTFLTKKKQKTKNRSKHGFLTKKIPNLIIYLVTPRFLCFFFLLSVISFFSSVGNGFKSLDVALLFKDMKSFLYGIFVMRQGLFVLFTLCLELKGM